MHLGPVLGLSWTCHGPPCASLGTFRACLGLVLWLGLGCLGRLESRGSGSKTGTQFAPPPPPSQDRARVRLWPKTKPSPARELDFANHAGYGFRIILKSRGLYYQSKRCTPEASADLPARSGHLNTWDTAMWALVRPCDMVRLGEY